MNLNKKLLSNNQTNKTEITIQKFDSKSVCRLFKIHLHQLYDHIYVPFYFFKNDFFNINKVLYNNDDILFYNSDFLIRNDKVLFYKVFDRYVSMLEEIFNPKNKLTLFLKKWTDTSNESDSKWYCTKTNSYLKLLLEKKKYSYISPLFIAEKYNKIVHKYPSNEKKVKTKIEKNLDSLIDAFKIELREFKKNYNDMLTTYVVNAPLNKNTEIENDYTYCFVNSLLLEIIEFSNKLIDLNIYAIHTIVFNVINNYVPLDEINHYKESSNGNRKLYIV